MKDNIAGIIEQINKDSRNERRLLSQRKSQHVIPVAEVISAEVGHMLVKPRISDEAREKGKAEIKQMVSKIIDNTKQVNAALVKKAESKLQEAEQSQDKAEIATAKTALKVVVENAEKAVATVEKRFQFDSNCRKFTDVVGTGGLFEISAHGDDAWITINTATNSIQEFTVLLKDKELEGLLDLMIFSIAWSEHVDSPDKKVDWEHIRREISAQAEIFVSSMAPLVE